MTKQLPPWQHINAWREILARVFEGLDPKLNVTPAWLVNPATNRRLKLDLLYETLGLAVRFEGLQGKQRRRRLSLQEEEQQETRDMARVEVCQQHGIQLVVINTHEVKPHVVFRDLDMALSRAVAALDAGAEQAEARAARSRAAEIARRVQKPDDLKLYATLWEDRQYQVPEPEPTPAAPVSVAFAVGQAVEHPAFGPGVITGLRPQGDDTFLTIDFVEKGEKTLMASLVADKLAVKD